MIELLNSHVLKAVEHAGTGYYDKECADSKVPVYDSLPLWTVSLFVRNNIITVIYLTLFGMKLYKWYKLAMQDQCSTVILHEKAPKTSKIVLVTIPTITITRTRGQQLLSTCLKVMSSTY